MAQANFAEEKWLQGYGKAISGPVINYYSQYPGLIPTLLVRTTDGSWAVEWETEAVPANFAAPEVHFVWEAGFASGYGAHKFELVVNGKPMCSFRSAATTSDREWEMPCEDGAHLAFRTSRVGRFNEMFGFMTMRLPRGLFIPGKAVSLRVVGEAGGSQDYYLVPERPISEWLRLRPEEAVLRGDQGPLRSVRFELSHIGPDTRLHITTPDRKTLTLPLHFGFNETRFDIPTKTQSSKVELKIQIGESVERREVLELQEVPKRTFFILHHSHLDMGYSDHQTEVERKQIAILKDAVSLIASTADRPPDARFRWNVEALWVVERFMARATPREKEQFIAAFRSGDLGLSALYANVMTGLCPPEELEKLLALARSLSRQYKVPIQSAMITDIPGANWNLVSALAGSGVRYFASGPNYMPSLAGGGDRIGGFLQSFGDKPFYWQSATGQEKVLTWVAGRGYSLFHANALGRPEGRQALLDYAADLTAKGYPYEYVQLNYTVGGDNGPVDAGLSDAVEKWNLEYETPHLVIATADQAFRELEKRSGDRLPSFAGDLSGYWEDGALSSARETASNRRSVQRLLQAATVWAIRQPGPYPTQEFAKAWKNALLWDEHTWGAADSISAPDRPEVIAQWETKRAFAVKAEQGSRQLLAQALAGSASQKKTPTRSLDVINTLSWPRSGVIILPANLPRTGDRVTDQKGNALPSQCLADGALAILSPAVPALGALRLNLQPGSPLLKGDAVAAERALFNSHLSLRVDARSGAITDLFCLKCTAENLVSPGAGLNSYLYVPGLDPTLAQTNGDATITIIEKGPLVAALRIESTAPGARRLVRELRLDGASNTLDIIDYIDKIAVRSKESVHFAFPFAIPGGTGRYDLGAAIVVPDVNQLAGSCSDFLPIHSAVDLSNAQFGVTLMSLEAPLVEVGAVTDERTDGGYGRRWHEKASPGTTVYSYVMNNYWHTNFCADQQGETAVHYAIQPHGPFDTTQLRRSSLNATRPLLIAPAAAEINPPAPLFAVKPDRVVVTAMEPASQPNAFRARLFNSSDTPQAATIVCGMKPCHRISITDPDGYAVVPKAGPIPLAPHAAVWLLITK